MLILGIALRLAAASGVLLTVMMWTVVLIVLGLLYAGNTLGLGRLWAATPLVRRVAWLK
jgi:thiosulfate dehydrogenase (quinone) large subunit